MEIKEMIKRKHLCEKFIYMEDIGRPLIGLMWEPTILPIESYVNRIDQSIPARSEDILAEEMCNECDKIIYHYDKIDQDFLFSVQASFNHLWLSAALGCPIKVTKDTIWSESSGLSIRDIAKWNIDIDYSWVEKLI